MRRIKNAGNACPCCRDEDFNSLLNKEKRRVVHGLKVYCTNKDTGCTWTGELGEVERHLQKRLPLNSWKFFNSLLTALLATVLRIPNLPITHCLEFWC